MKSNVFSFHILQENYSGDKRNKVIPHRPTMNQQTDSALKKKMPKTRWVMLRMVDE